MEANAGSSCVVRSLQRVSWLPDSGLKPDEGVCGIGWILRRFVRFRRELEESG